MGLQCPQKCARACDRGSSAENFLFWPNEKLRVRLESVQARDRGAAAGQEQAPIRERGRGMEGAGQIKPEIRLNYIGTLVTMSQ
jgi:hypothetical protein